VPSIHTNRGIGRARKARLALDFPLDAPLGDVVELVERDGVCVVIVELRDGIAGAYLRRSTGPILFVNARHNTARQRFTVAHEFGHHRLDHTSVIDGVAALTDTGHDPQEVEANAFAAEFLIPRDAIEKRYRRNVALALTLDDVVVTAAVFGVSAQMARYRLASHGVLANPALCARLDGEIAQELHLEAADRLGLDFVDDTVARHAGGVRIPPSMSDSALGRFLEGELSIDVLAASLGRSPDAVRERLSGFGLVSELSQS
jgi:Zn-dependent peptidase ImmA (M78 family)